jgi:50S ribosomal protein L16 3-hydroxylase
MRQHATVRNDSGAGIDSRRTPLGDTQPAQFLKRFWQKEALLVRNALPGFRGLFDASQLLELAARDDVESRIVVRDGRRWTLMPGPFRRRDFKSLPERDWTLLVQGVNFHSRDADALLRRFSFLPYARLDDLMVSYAVPGGGVGPHFDSYDVFLLQGFGRRRWRYGRQQDLALRPRLPLKILKRFDPQRSEVLDCGDLLYLPPDYAHDGVALDACTTYSIGFRAATANELAVAFIDFVRDELDLPGRYADGDLAATRTPAKIEAAMQRRCAHTLSRIRWNRETIDRFLGCWLSEPKPSLFFERPASALRLAAFQRRIGKHGVYLDVRTQLLYDADHLFINGTALSWPVAGKPFVTRLADQRALTARDAAALPTAISALLHDWYSDGFLHPGDA